MNMVRLSALRTDCLYLQEILLVTLRIEPATCRLAVQCLKPLTQKTLLSKLYFTVVLLY